MDAASKLDGALAAVANATIELISVDQEIFSNWPDVLPRADLLAYTRASIIEALSTRAPSRPLFAGIVRTVADHGSYDFAAAVDEMNRELMEELQSASIPDPTEDAEAA